MNFNLCGDYKKIVDVYNDNKDKYWEEWLEFSEIISSGKQGFVGIFNIKNTNYKVIFKISQRISHLIQHEFAVSKDINKLCEYVPFFCRSYGNILCESNPECNLSTEPFRINKDDNDNKDKNKFEPLIERDVLLLEHLQGCTKLYNYIKTNNISDDVIHSIIQNVLCSILIAQNDMSFTHYDLHSDNILVKDCNKNVCFVYKFNNKDCICFPSYGKHPIIIDYGFSYSKSLDDNYIWSSLSTTDVGFTSTMFDKVSDPKIFLITTTKELKEYRYGKYSLTMREFVRNNYEHLNIDWNCGWFKYDSATDIVINKIEEYANCTSFFKNNIDHCIDICNSLIVLPLEECKHDNIQLSFTVLLSEFAKIEEQIVSHYYCLYIFDVMINIAREVRILYNDAGSRARAVKFFHEKLVNYIDSIAKYVVVKNIDFNKLLCAIYEFSRCLEGIYYKYMTKYTEINTKKYKNVKYKNPYDIILQLNKIKPININIDRNTIFFVIDCMNKTNYKITTTDEIISKLNGKNNIEVARQLLGNIC